MTAKGLKEFHTASYAKEDPILHVIFVPEGRDEPNHTHDFIEIVYTASGEMDQIVNGESFETKRGDLVFLNYDSTHSFSCVPGTSYYNICFYPETMEKLVTPDNAFALLTLSSFNKISRATNEGIVHFSEEERPIVEGLLNNMLLEQKGKQKYYDMINESYMNVLIALILRKVGPTLPEQKNVWSNLADYIRDNLDANLSLKALAAKCFYNPSYFSRAFKKRFGMNLVDYVNQQRVQEAARLLATTDLSVEEISRRVGFTSKSVFYRSFGKETGTSPSDYREKSGKSE